MTRQNIRSWSIFSKKSDLQTRPRQFTLFWHQRVTVSPSSIAAPSPMFVACQDNDLARVESCLKEMNHKEIDRQYPPNNETALHVATRNQNKEIIRILLLSGTQRSIKNAYGQQARELAETNEIKDLFKRPKSSRFVFVSNTCTTAALSQQNIQCKSCSLIDDNNFYEWELIDQNAMERALRFRRESKPSTLMTGRMLKQKIYSINKGYLPERLQHICPTIGARIYSYFQYASLEQDPDYIIKAYTISQSFSELLNKDMSRNVKHDLKDGCSKFSCDCLYSTEDGTKSITSILLYHPKFHNLSFKGIVHRGIVVSKNAFAHYKVNSCIITTTFLATSKDPMVAQTFCDKGVSNPDIHSFFCTYEIVNDERTALDISGISEYRDENEILIVPYSAFLITKIEDGEETTNIYLKELCLTQV